MFTVTRQVTQTFAADLRNLPYLDWPNEARALARVVLSRQGGLDAFLGQLDRKDWLVAEVMRLQAQNNSIAEWLGEA